MSEPNTPVHAGPDEQLDLDEVKELSDEDIEELDLKPMDVDVDVNNDIHVKREFNKLFDEDMQMAGDDMDDFRPRVNIDSPFSSYANLSKLQGEGHRQQRKLSMSQQSKFIAYCDQKLMDIQRKFVQSRGLNTQNGYQGLEPLLKDIKSLVDFIWYSLDGSPNTDMLLREDIDDDGRKQGLERDVQKDTHFGQSSYLIRIADDLLDYVEKFDLKFLSDEEQHQTLSKLFKLLFILDRIFAKLMDGDIPGGGRTNGTDAVRINGIAERTRMKLPVIFETQDIHGYHFEVSKVYERTLERCGG
ncbi:Uncharacterized protein RNJ44_04719 [Nakaseomyces bracarensis]|uniref:Uncharacterized protein n=1 Tax=Nakaseomyces bracarensis TaxID=273131 RepID=A0ABR4NVU6_9SACH